MSCSRSFLAPPILVGTRHRYREQGGWWHHTIRCDQCLGETTIVSTIPDIARAAIYRTERWTHRRHGDVWFDICPMCSYSGWLTCPDGVNN